jgi:plastocyanin
MSSTRSVLAAVVLALAVAGCGAPAGTPDDGVLRVTMSDYHFDPAAWTIPADEEVQVLLTNEDEVAHDLSIGRDVVTDQQQPIGYGTDLLSELDFEVAPADARSRSVSGPPSTLVTVAPGTTVALTFTAPPELAGDWEIGCFHSRGCHYNAGLRGTLAITAP